MGMLPTMSLRVFVVFTAAISRAAFLAAALPTVASRQVNAVLDGGPAPTNATWAAWGADLIVHRSNVTGIVPSAYIVTNVGDLQSRYTPAAAAVADRWLGYFATHVSLRVRPLVTASALGLALAIHNVTIGTNLVNALISKASALHHSGFGFLIEGERDASPSDKSSWTSLLRLWLAALENAGLDLSIIIRGSCSSDDAAEAFNMSCADYRSLALNASSPRPNLRLISLSTFTSASMTWMNDSNELLHGLGPSVAALGMRYNAPLVDPEHSCLTYALAGGFASLYVWDGLPSGVYAHAAWNAFGFWLSDVF